jgi:general secretion pathway protein I
MIAASPRMRRPGVSLLEVLIALAIFLLCFAAIGQLVDVAADHALSTRFQNTGTRLAVSKMHEVEIGAIPVSTGGSGDFSADGDDGWQWTVTSSATDIANVYSVTVSVSRDYRGRPFEIILTQTVFDPLIMGTAAEAQPPEPPSGTEGM